MKRWILFLIWAGFASLIPFAINYRGIAADSNLSDLRVPAPEFPAPASGASGDITGAGAGSRQSSAPTASNGTTGAGRGGELSSMPSPGGSQPEFPASSESPDGVTWINSKPLSMHGLHGKVVMIDFWDYTCINCIRTFPFNKKLWDHYKSDGLVLIGVDDAEFSSAMPVDRA